MNMEELLDVCAEMDMLYKRYCIRFADILNPEKKMDYKAFSEDFGITESGTFSAKIWMTVSARETGQAIYEYTKDDWMLLPEYIDRLYPGAKNNQLKNLKKFKRKLQLRKKLL